MERVQDVVDRVLGSGFAVFVVLLFAALPAAGGGTTVKTLAAFPGVVHTFAYQDGRVGWTESSWELRTRTVGAKRQQTTYYTSQYEERAMYEAGRLVLSGRRAIVLSSRGDVDVADRVMLATIGQRRAREIEKRVHADGGGGGYVTALAGGAGFAYGVAEVDKLGEDVEEYRVVGGGVWTVDAGKKKRLTGAPPPAFLARAGNRIALVPADLEVSAYAEPSPSNRVEIRDAKTGALTASFESSAIGAIALSPRIAAVFAGLEIETYDSRTGLLLASWSVPNTNVGELDIAGQRIVFRDARSIRLLDAGSGQVSVIARIPKPWRPLGVSIENRTVMWAETVQPDVNDSSRRKNRSRIRMVVLPPTP